MDYTPNDTKEDMLAAREKISALIRRYMESEGYQLLKNSRFTHSLDAFYYQYQNSAGNRDMIKLELNYSLRAHVLEPVYKRIIPEAFDDGMKIHMVNPMEIFAAKGNALISRAAARDLYDWGNLIEENLFAEEQELFRKCFVFYATISAEKVNMNFDTSAIDALKFDKIRRDLFPVLRKKDNFMLEERKQQAKEYIAELMQLTEREHEYMNQFIAKEYVPELLFDDEEIVERIKEHPMAIWKCQR
jgi:predicted nucleotidyltransferase component of viral defense system